MGLIASNPGLLLCAHHKAFLYCRRLNPGDHPTWDEVMAMLQYWSALSVVIKIPINPLSCRRFGWGRQVEQHILPILFDQSYQFLNR
jgi:hypothetical protein